MNLKQPIKLDYDDVVIGLAFKELKWSDFLITISFVCAGLWNIYQYNFYIASLWMLCAGFLFMHTVKSEMYRIVSGQYKAFMQGEFDRLEREKNARNKL